MRDNINVNSSLKLFESYRNFGGGLNTQQSNEMMHDDHVTISENVDLAWTQSIKRRYGRSAINSLPETTPLQGLFSFVNNAETVLIIAINGKLYYSRPSGTAYGSWVQIPILDAGSAFTFQTTDEVEAVQYADWLYVATGTKLVRCQVYQDGSNVTQKSAETVVDQFKPSSQEAFFIGLNALNTTPTAYLVDLNTSATNDLTILGIYSDTAYPSVHTNINAITTTLTAYRKTSNTSPYFNVDYKWEYKLSSDTAWTSAPAPYGTYNSSTPNQNKSWPVVLEVPGTYDFRVTARLSANNATTDDYVIYGVVVANTVQRAPLASTAIQRCRKCVLHWDRLILYDPKPTSTVGTSDERDHIFISDVANLLYFPTFNVISFAADTQQRVRKICRYRNILLVFTPDTIQSLTGTDPSNYRRSLINNQIGALWSNSVQVVENQVFFVSKQGMYMINPNTYVQDNFNVVSIDDHIKDQFSDAFIKSDDTAASGLATQQVVSMVHNNQYWLYNYGSNAKLYRYYYKTRSWVVDTFSHLGTISFISPIIASYNNDQSLLEPAYRTVNGTSAPIIMGEDKTSYADLGIAYTMKLRTKFFDLSYAFNFKKLRKLYVLGHVQNYPINLAVRVEADSTTVLEPDVGSVSVDSITGAVTWKITPTPNFVFQDGTYPGTSNGWILGNAISNGLGNVPLGDVQLAVIKSNIRAKCRRVRLTFEHAENKACEIYGFGLEFRAKRP